MDQDEIVAHDKKQLDELEDDINEGRRHLEEMTHEDEASLFEAEDTQAEPAVDGDDDASDSDVQPPM